MGVLDLLAKALIADGVAAMRGNADLTQQLCVQVGCKQSAKE
jgi:hypothetical protein